MHFKRRGRLGLRDKLAANNVADRYYAAMAGVEPQGQSPIPPKRERAKPDPANTEGPVLAAVGDLLAAHPLVLLAVRQNSGAMAYEKEGRSIPVWFYKLVRNREITLTDYWGFLRDGRPFAIECKRPGWKRPSDDRERKQEAFIHMIESIGGVGAFVRNADEALRCFVERSA